MPHLKTRSSFLHQSQWFNLSLCCFVSLLVSSVSWAQLSDSEVIDVSLGGSTVINLSRVSLTLTDQTVAEISKTSGGILVIGRKVGETNLIASGEEGVRTYLIKVSLPAQAIQSEIKALFPYEKTIRIRAVGGALVLEGSVSGIQVVEQVEAVAVGYLMSPSIAALNVKPNVINLLKVRSQQQVQIDVRFAEVNRLSLREIGTDFSSVPNTSSGFAVGGSLGKPIQNFGRLLFNNSGSFPFEAALNLFAERSLSRTLAEPTLVALSGEKASFLAGGEQPVPQVSGLGVPSIEYKKFGIQLDFAPTVLANQTIELNTQMSVSVLDNSQTLSVAGTDVPLFRTRASSTTVRLVNGQSFAIAGLLQDQMENAITYMPGLGEIPILGMLFNSRRFQRRETELVVVITARLVNPIDSAALPPLPGHTYSSDPSDVHVFLLNGFEAPPPKKKRRSNRRTRRVSAMPLRGQTPSGQMGFWR